MSAKSEPAPDVPSHVSAAFRAENVAVHGSADELQTDRRPGPARRRGGGRAGGDGAAGSSGSRSTSSSSCREAPLAELASPSPEDVVERFERRWAFVVARHRGHRLRGHRLHRPALGRATAVERRDHRRQPPAPGRRVRRSQPRHRAAAGRLGDGARHRAAVFVRAVVHRRADRDAGRLPRHQPGRGARLPDRRHQRQQHGACPASSPRCARASTSPANT